MIHATKLQQKGWSREEILKTLSIIKEARSRKEPFVKALDVMMYWIILFISLLMSFVVSIAIIPLLLALNGILLYASIFIIAFGFGYFFELLLRDIENLEKKHHILINFLLPIFAIINFFFIINYSNNLEKILHINNAQHPYAMGIFYVVSFLLPYLYHHVFKNRGP